MTDADNLFKKPLDSVKHAPKSHRALPAGVSRADIEIPSPSENQPAEDVDKKLSSDGIEIPPIPYVEPSWSQKCDPSLNYSFEVLKNGVIIEEVKHLQNKVYWLFGRLPNCCINMAHPTISRYHAVLQYRGVKISDDNCNEDETEIQHITEEPGWYLYDLNSTHGTFLNKQRLPPKTYVRVKVGYMIKLGSSSRSYILQGPAEDEDEPSAMSITEIKELRKKQEQLRNEISEIEKQEKERIEKLKEQEGINWGMAEDADEETDLTHNPFAVSNNEELFLDDPKKTLRGYFEREGHELDYKLEELSAGSYVCRVELPVDDDFGRPMVAEATHKGKKKEVVVQCALEACRILDRCGLLRQATHEPRRRFKKTSDSDDDDFLDRTGDVERRRQRKQTKLASDVHTYEDLIRQESVLLERLEEIEDKIQRRQMIDKGTRLPEDDDNVDEFLEKLSAEKPYDKFEVRRLRLEKERLSKEHVMLQKLIKIAKPIDLPSLSDPSSSAGSSKEQLKKKVMPLFGKRIKINKTFGIKESTLKVGGTTSAHGEEIEEDEEEADVSCDKNPPPKPILGPSFDPKLIDDSSKAVDKVTVPKTNADTSDKADTSPDRLEHTISPSDPKKRKNDSEMEESSETTAKESKKKRNRNRVRERNRDNVDFDDSEELQNEEKNVEWVPPQDQKGDGITSLNEKYGY